MMLVSLILLVILAGSVQAAREEDRVTYLPGLDPQPDFNHYAGYLDVDGNKKFFYWSVIQNILFPWIIRVYLPLHKVVDTPFHTQENDIMQTSYCKHYTGQLFRIYVLNNIVHRLLE